MMQSAYRGKVLLTGVLVDFSVQLERTSDKLMVLTLANPQLPQKVLSLVLCFHKSELPVLSSLGHVCYFYVEGKKFKNSYIVNQSSQWQILTKPPISSKPPPRPPTSVSSLRNCLNDCSISQFVEIGLVVTGLGVKYTRFNMLLRVRQIQQKWTVLEDGNGNCFRISEGPFSTKSVVLVKGIDRIKEDFQIVLSENWQILRMPRGCWDQKQFEQIANYQAIIQKHVYQEVQPHFISSILRLPSDSKETTLKELLDVQSAFYLSRTVSRTTWVSSAYIVKAQFSVKLWNKHLRVIQKVQEDEIFGITSDKTERILTGRLLLKDKSIDNQDAIFTAYVFNWDGRGQFLPGLDLGSADIEKSLRWWQNYLEQRSSYRARLLFKVELMNNWMHCRFRIVQTIIESVRPTIN